MNDSKPTNPKDIVGIKKAPLSVVPMGVVAEVGVAMLEGASKYGRHNYRAVGVRGSVYFDATMRHMISWWEGEDVDPDSQLSHITKAIASLTVLRDAMMQGMLTDDRPPRSKPFYPGLNAGAAAMIEKHADKAPFHYTEQNFLSNEAVLGVGDTAGNGMIKLPDAAGIAVPPSMTEVEYVDALIAAGVEAGVAISNVRISALVDSNGFELSLKYGPMEGKRFDDERRRLSFWVPEANRETIVSVLSLIPKDIPSPASVVIDDD